MGISLSFDCYQGSCGSFNEWRYYLAKLAGYEMVPINIKYCSLKEQPKLDWDSYTKENINGIWNETPKDPLVVLLYHSDEEGIINVPQLKPLQERLKELLPLIEVGDWYHRQVTENFIKGLENAIKANEKIQF